MLFSPTNPRLLIHIPKVVFFGKSSDKKPNCFICKFQCAREKLQRTFLNAFKVIFTQFSVNVSDEISTTNIKSLYTSTKTMYRPLKG